MYTVLLILFIIIQAIIGFYLLQPLLLLLLHLLAKPFHPKNAAPAEAEAKDMDIAVIVTAYKNLGLVTPLADSLLKQRYSRFTAYIVADACEGLELGEVNDERIVLLRTPSPLTAKIRSIDYALKNCRKEHDAMVILDADNLVHPNYLEVLNGYFKRGYRAVQTNLMAKNLNNAYARMDAAGNYFYNFIDRKIRMEFGLSANIWGLGIAMKTELYRSVIYRNFLGGFDKKIQADIVKVIPQLAYAEEAYVYDEKIDTGDALETQRTRWINAYFKYFKYGWQVLTAGIRRGSFNLFYFGVNLLRPPQFLQLLGGMLMLLINIWVSPPAAWLWLVILAQFPLSFLSIVAVMNPGRGVLKSLAWLPLVFARQLKAFFQIRKANKTFLQTSNNKVIYIEDVINQ
ncbi:MAG: glycosyltransferase [Chitinophaga sp.]